MRSANGPHALPTTDLSTVDCVNLRFSQKACWSSKRRGAIHRHHLRLGCHFRIQGQQLKSVSVAPTKQSPCLAICCDLGFTRSAEE